MSQKPIPLPVKRWTLCKVAPKGPALAHFLGEFCSQQIATLPTANYQTESWRTSSARQMWSCGRISQRYPVISACQIRPRFQCFLTSACSSTFLRVLILLTLPVAKADWGPDRSIQYHAHLILLHRPLIRNKGRRSSTSADTSANDGSNKGDEYENQHMATCRHSATEIARLLRTYKQQYTLVRTGLSQPKKKMKENVLTAPSPSSCDYSR